MAVWPMVRTHTSTASGLWLQGLPWRGTCLVWESTGQVPLPRPSQSRSHPSGQLGRGRLSPSAELEGVRQDFSARGSEGQAKAGR